MAGAKMQFTDWILIPAKNNTLESQSDRLS